MHAIERQISHQNWVTMFVVLSIVVLSILKFYKPKRLFGYFVAFFTQGFFEKRVEENPSIFSGFHGGLFLFSSIVYALTLSFIGFSENITLSVFIGVFLVIIIYIFLRNILDFLIEKLLLSEEQTKYFRFMKLGYLYTLALWLLPFVVVYYYGFQNQKLLIGTFLILMLLRFGLVVVNNKNLIFNRLFYFILYFCTLEIAPLLIFYKSTMV